MNGVTGRMGRTQVTSERAHAVKAALAAGKHIYCEKLIAHDLRTARKLSELATQSGLKNGVVQDKLLWQLPGGELLRLIKDRFLQYV